MRGTIIRRLSLLVVALALVAASCGDDSTGDAPVVDTAALDQAISDAAAAEAEASDAAARAADAEAALAEAAQAEAALEEAMTAAEAEASDAAARAAEAEAALEEAMAAAEAAEAAAAAAEGNVDPEVVAGLEQELQAAETAAAAAEAEAAEAAAAAEMAAAEVAAAAAREAAAEEAAAAAEAAAAEAAEAAEAAAAEAAAAEAEAASAAAAQPCDGPAEVQDIKLMTDWFLWAATGPFAAAVDAGYYTEEGINLELLPAPDAAAPVKFAARGTVHFALSYVPETLLAQETGIPVISVGTTLRVLQSATAYWPDSGINEPADLAGRTIGVTSDLQTQTYFDALLRYAGLTRDDVTVVDPGFASTQMLADRELEASAAQLVFTDVVRFPALVDDTPAHFVYTDYGVPDYYWMLILTESSFAEDNPNTVCRFLRATAKGIDAYLDNPDPANAYIFAENEWLPLEVHAAMGENLSDFWKDPATGRALWQDEAVWQAAHDWALETGLISLDNDPSVYFSNDYLPPELK